jgi:hypothetical protein
VEDHAGSVPGMSSGGGGRQSGAVFGRWEQARSCSAMSPTAAAAAFFTAALLLWAAASAACSAAVAALLRITIAPMAAGASVVDHAVAVSAAAAFRIVSTNASLA